MTPEETSVMPPTTTVGANANSAFSYGQKAVGLTFNPSGDASVQKIKELYAQIIDIMDEFREVKASNMKGEHKRLASVAITEAQTAQMRAVKALTWRD